MPQPSISETEIVNQALVRIGQKPILSIDNTSTDQGNAAAILYAQSRDALLRRLRWNFARVFAPLATLPKAPLNLAILPDPDYAGQIVYSGAYQLPSDYLRLSAVSPYSAHWRIVGQAIYTDAPPATSGGPLIGTQPPNANGADNLPPNPSTVSGTPIGIEYIARVTDVTKFEPLFIEVLAVGLARDLCFAGTALESLRQQLAAEYKDKFAEASAIEGMEQWPEQLFDTVLVDVRYGYASSAGSASGLFG